jgi:hypothetical protein
MLSLMKTSEPPAIYILKKYDTKTTAEVANMRALPASGSLREELISQRKSPALFDSSLFAMSIP